MNDKPTQEQVETLLKWCGWEYRRSNPHHFADNIEAQKRDYGWYHPLDKGEGYVNIPRIDLNLLFRYAVPRLFETVGESKAIGLLIDWVKSLRKRTSKGYWDFFWVLLELAEKVEKAQESTIALSSKAAQQ